VLPRVWNVFESAHIGGNIEESIQTPCSLDSKSMQPFPLINEKLKGIVTPVVSKKIGVATKYLNLVIIPRLRCQVERMAKYGNYSNVSP
jgi:hypothetical protein